MAKAKQYDISEEKYLNAINWLEDGGTKKGACGILGVSSNSIMERLIQEFYDRKRRDKEQRARKRKLAISPSEKVEIITDYLNGFTLGDLSESHYRSTDTIKSILINSGAMLRGVGKINPLSPPLMPDQCVAHSFDKEQYVWSAKYGCIAQVVGNFGNAYRIQVLGNGLQEQSYQSVHELGSLKHLEELGVKLSAFEDYMKGDEVKQTLYKTMVAANKRDK